MAKTTGTAREFILETLTAHPDRELQVADFSSLCSDKFSKANLSQTLARLVADGQVVKATEPDRSAWYAIRVGVEKGPEQAQVPEQPAASTSKPPIRYPRRPV